MTLTEAGLTSTEIAKIRLIAKIFNCQRMTITNKIVDKQDISGRIIGEEGK